MFAVHRHKSGEILHWLSRALDVLYPPRCGGCDEVGKGWWCEPCNVRAQAMALSNPVQTIVLGTPWEGVELTVLSAMPFTQPIREGIHSFKYGACPHLAEPLGQYLVAVWHRCDLRADAVVPVPLHAARQRERGYNQSQLLARILSRSTGVPLDTRLLKRIRNTAQQTQLDAEARTRNVRGAFEALAGRYSSGHIVLVDDVLTTGATLAACASAMLSAGVRQVSAITLARAA